MVIWRIRCTDLIGRHVLFPLMLRCFRAQEIVALRGGAHGWSSRRSVWNWPVRAVNRLGGEELDGPDLVTGPVSSNFSSYGAGCCGIGVEKSRGESDIVPRPWEKSSGASVLRTDVYSVY
jgi:hypothetical protein